VTALLLVARGLVLTMLSHQVMVELRVEVLAPPEGCAVRELGCHAAVTGLELGSLAVC
jgi:hypothetical protein